MIVDGGVQWGQWIVGVIKAPHLPEVWLHLGPCHVVFHWFSGKGEIQ